MSNVDHKTIAALRKEMARCKGISQRARASAYDLRCKAADADEVVRRCKYEIKRLGGTVRE